MATEFLPPRLAAIDLGTNTFRLVARGMQRVEYPRIGQGVDRTGRIASAAVRRGMAALSSFHRIVRQKRLCVAGVVGTSALRDAKNGPAFCEAVRRRFGWNVEIISGEEEAALTFLGATTSLQLPKSGTILVSDIGGGSTELIWGTASSASTRVGTRDCQIASMTPIGLRMAGRVSLELGSVRMTERFGTQDRVRPDKLARLQLAVRRILLNSGVPWSRIRAVTGVGGTATTLAAILYGVEPYDEHRVHGASVPLSSMKKMRDVLAVMTPRERMLLPSVPKGRADIIVAGTAIQTEIVRLARVDTMIASDAGILTGLILKSGGSKGPRVQG